MPGPQAALGGGLFLQRLWGAGGGDGGEAAPPVTPKGAGPVDQTRPPRRCWTGRCNVAPLPAAPGASFPVLGPVSPSTNSQGGLDQGPSTDSPHPCHPAQEIGWKLQPLLLQKQGHGPHCLLRHFHHTPGGSREAPWSHVPWWRFDNSKGDHSRFALEPDPGQPPSAEDLFNPPAT